MFWKAAQCCALRLEKRELNEGWEHNEFWTPNRLLEVPSMLCSSILCGSHYHSRVHSVFVCSAWRPAALLMVWAATCSLHLSLHASHFFSLFFPLSSSLYAPPSCCQRHSPCLWHKMPLANNALFSCLIYFGFRCVLLFLYNNVHIALLCVFMQIWNNIQKTQRRKWQFLEMHS